MDYCLLSSTEPTRGDSAISDEDLSKRVYTRVISLISMGQKSVSRTAAKPR